MTSYLLTKLVAERAVKSTLLMLPYWLELGWIEHPNTHFVVLDPTITQKAGYDFHEAIVFDHDNGNPKEDYRRIARAKAKISWETGLPSHVAQQMYPHYFQLGDTKWGGSAVYMSIVVACSGLPWQWDWSLSASIAAAIHGQCSTGMRNMLADPAAFFGQEEPSLR